MENPYIADNLNATPSDYAQGSGIDADLLISASLGRRFCNNLLDILVSQVLITAFFFVSGMVVAAAAGPESAAFQSYFSLVDQFAFPITLLMTVAYYVFFETLFQRSPAKWLTGTMVVTQDGDKPSFGQIVGRSFARNIPFDHLSILFSDEIRAWHDSLSKTKVVMVAKIAP
ncbi:RDD family protein [Acanthopleuribacter pedis]|uniref:RDD family protein n=1 Tax=Acanthopleuribacter pedis TaxID=442870 RepID=A0A8J7QBS0_9BACT|nr:RDD family protein [Acanthopleuribacter pedis]MBO1318056.1 RDD family protein [Acanthopleuribacter pedis]